MGIRHVTVQISPDLISQRTIMRVDVRFNDGRRLLADQTPISINDDMESLFDVCLDHARRAIKSLYRAERLREEEEKRLQEGLMDGSIDLHKIASMRTNEK